jgi:uncharacterized cupin superfamily protein
VFDAKIAYDAEDPEGYRGGGIRIGPFVGAAKLGATLYELPAGQGIAPYHYEYGNEEWLIVLAGCPVLRHSQGEDELAPGDVVCFPVGPDGAHKVTNRTNEVVRVLMLSTQEEPAVVVYPDSDKIGVWTGEERDDLLVRRESRVDYWDGESLGQSG